MKKNIFLIILTLNFSVYAENAVKIEKIQNNFIQNIYSDSVKGKNSLELLKSYADKELKYAIELNDKISKNGEVCLDYDPLWESQDPKKNVPLSITSHKNKVFVKFLQNKDKTEVIFTVKCLQNNKCSISDVNDLKSIILGCQ